MSTKFISTFLFHSFILICRFVCFSFLIHFLNISFILGLFGLFLVCFWFDFLLFILFFIFFLFIILLFSTKKDQHDKKQEEGIYCKNCGQDDNCQIQVILLNCRWWSGSCGCEPILVTTIPVATGNLTIELKLRTRT